MAMTWVPRATLEIPGSARRLDRIWSLIRGCRYSIHDLSRVELDPTPPATPRFNMPFELGMAVAYEQARSNKAHSWFVFETMPWRFQKSLSDLNGTEVYIHGGTTDGVFRELSAAFVRNDHQPSVAEMRQILDGLRQGMPKILRRAGTDTPFHARVFRELSVYASAIAGEVAR